MVFDRNTQCNRYIVSHFGPSRPEYRRDRSEFDVYIVCNIGKRKIGAREAVVSTNACTCGALEANAVMSNHRI